MIRKLGNKEELERKKKLKTSIISIILLLILILSTLGFAFFSNPEILSNEGEIKQPPTNQGNNHINLNYQGSQINLLSTYQEIESIPVNINKSIKDYSGITLYIDSKNDRIFREIGTTLGQIASRVQKACYEKCEENIPEKTCKDNLVISLQSSEKKVYQQENCIFIEGDIAAADAFLYKLFNNN